MKQAIKQLWENFGIRLIPSLTLFGLSFWILFRAVGLGHSALVAGGMLIGLALMLLGAIVIAPSIAGMLVDRVVDFFTFSEKFDRAPPMYSNPEGMRKSRRLYEEAMAAYEKIAEAYPDELRPHLEMIDIALHDLNEPAKAEQVYQQGVLKFKNEADRERLARKLSGLRLKP